MAGRQSGHVKVVMLGNTGAGKSCVVNRYIRGEFTSDTEPTIGAAFFTKMLLLPDADIKLEIWDTAGQERYKSLAPMYYRGAAAAVIVFDMTSRDSFEGARQWIRELQKRQDTSSMILALAGNKVDLASSRTVASDEAASFALENRLIYVETSAKTNINIDRLFTEVATRAPHTPTAAGPKAAVKLGKASVRGTPERGAAAGGCCG